MRLLLPAVGDRSELTRATVEVLCAVSDSERLVELVEPAEGLLLPPFPVA